MAMLPEGVRMPWNRIGKDTVIDVSALAPDKIYECKVMWFQLDLSFLIERA